MFKGEFTFDLKHLRGTPQYRWAYVTTNEPIDKYPTLVPPQNKRILTVAASGDQPLAYAAAGAAHIDTFDITINACAIMDFKTTALKMPVDKAEYEKLILSFKDLRKPYDLFPHIVNNMPDRTRALMEYHTENWFNGVFTTEYFKSVYEPHFDAITRNALNTPFNFIWTDLINLHKYLDCTYDIIYLSNIFDHYHFHKRTSDIFQTIWHLWPHLNTGGQMLCTSNQPAVKSLFNSDERILKETATTFPPFNGGFLHWQPIIIQKTR